MKVALVTPWPADRSGIADYAFTLVQGLSKLPIFVTVYTQAAHPLPFDEIRIVNEPSDSWDLSHFDLIVYQIGNNVDFHGHMLDLLKRFPGIVHLHDFVLQHLFAGIASIKNDWPSYLDALTRLYGAAVSTQAKTSLASKNPFWERDDVIRFPMCEVVLEHCKGFIVHSRFVHDEIRRVMPTLPGIVIPQGYPDEPYVKVPPNKGEFRIGVFGHVQPNRCIDLLLQALQKVNIGNRKISIRVVGPCIDPTYKEFLLELLKPLDGHVRFETLGYANHQVFLNEIASCDLCVSLRNPTVGETSAVVTRAMKLGKPTIVTNAGWYAELPECILKIQPGPCGGPELIAILERILHDENYLIQIRNATLKFAEKEYDFDTISKRYCEALHEFYSFTQSDVAYQTDLSCTVNSLASAFSDLQIDSENDEAGLREMVYRKLKFCFER